ncbi:branched-chain amino acid ABC transporter permease [Bradyrhizobium sp. 187]|nr:branched-chain amino acid ABC transporter permease [Bradyrhizobium sp. 187]
MLTTLAAIGAILLPIVVREDYAINVSSQIIIFALLALSLNVLVGLGGMISLGHSAFLGLSAYACVWLTNIGWHPAAAAAGALVLGTAMAGFLGVLSLRVSGLSFMMITLAFGQIVWGIAYRWVSITNGDNGLKLPSRPSILGYSIAGNSAFYYFCLAVLIVALIVMWRLANSPFGAVLRGSRDQPRRMRMLGHNVQLIRWIAFLMAGFWGSAAGVLYVYYTQFVSPHAVSLQQSAETLLMVLLGGVDTLAGPIIGAIIITFVKLVLSSYLDRWYSVLGVIFIAAVILMPEGIVPSMRRWARWPKRGKLESASDK